MSSHEYLKEVEQIPKSNNIFRYFYAILWWRKEHAENVQKAEWILRSFIAIELPETAQSALSDLQGELKKYGADVRWVKPENIHLTLKFLGDVEENIVEGIIDSLKGTCDKHSTFSLELSGIGVFPNKKSPRVLWVGLTGSKILPVVQQEIDIEMATMGFKREKRRFAPHLTLGRFKSSFGKKDLLDKVSSDMNTEFGLIEVNSVSLMRSNLGPAGAKHTTIAKIDLINT